MYNEQQSYEEERLLKLLATGNEYAFQIIYDKNRDRIYKVAMRYLKSPVVAQEVVQDVFMKLWYKKEEIKPEMGVEAWLFTVTRNNVLNRLKKLSNEWKALDQLKLILPGEDDSLQQKIQQTDYLNMFNEALSSLSDMQLKVYKLAKEENLSYIQIGEYLNISPLTVKTHMSRALGHIRIFVNIHWNVLALFFVPFFINL